MCFGFRYSRVGGLQFFSFKLAKNFGKISQNVFSSRKKNSSFRTGCRVSFRLFRGRRRPSGAGRGRAAAESIHGRAFDDGGGDLQRARSRLDRNQFLRVNMRLKALAEVYTKHSVAPFWNPLAKNGEKRPGQNNPEKVKTRGH